MSEPEYVVKNVETGSICATFYDKLTADTAAALQNHAYQTDAYRVEKWEKWGEQ